MALPEKYNCIIVDDDELDRLLITAYARKYEFLNIVGVYSSALEAAKAIETENIDILLSDIDMPGLNGMDFRRSMMNIPVCIFITLYPDYAADSFELAALDFLVKPIKAERFQMAMQRCKEYLDIRHKAELLDFSLGSDTIFIKDGTTQIKLSLPQIIYLEALKDYTLIATADKKYRVLSAISSLLKEESFRSFIRIHRSFAVQKNFISNISSQVLTAGNHILPIGRNYKHNLDILS